MNSLLEISVSLLTELAYGQRKESPWYGSLNTILSLLNSIDDERLTVVVPQLVLGSDVTSDNDDEIDMMIDQARSPSTFTATSDPPSSPDPMDVLGINRGATPPSPTQSTFTSTASVEDVMMTPREFRSLISFRIPDFVRIRFYRGTPVIPQIRSQAVRRIDLIVEVKKKPTKYSSRETIRYQVEDQIESQAAHAFSSDSRLRRLGCLIVLGNEWLFRDIERPQTINIHNRHRDSTYSPSQSSGSRSSEPVVDARKTSRGVTIPPFAPLPHNLITIPTDYVRFLGPAAIPQQRKMLHLIHNHLEAMDASMIQSYVRVN